MGDPLFMDTSFALAGLDADDQWHPAAMRLKDVVATASRVVTTSAVVTEIYDAMSAPHWRTEVHRFVESILKNSKVVVVHVGPDLLRCALDLFGGRPDKHWSLTDCISFVCHGPDEGEERSDCGPSLRAGGLRGVDEIVRNFGWLNRQARFIAR